MTDDHRIPGLSLGDAESLFRAALRLAPVDLTTPHRTFMGAVWDGGGDIPLPLKEKVRLVAVTSVGCEFCSAVRFEADGERLLADEQTHLDATDDREEAALAFAAAVLRDPAAVPDDVLSAVGRHFSRSEIVELAICATAFSGFPKMVISLDLHGEVDGTIVQQRPTLATGPA